MKRSLLALILVVASGCAGSVPGAATLPGTPDAHAAAPLRPSAVATPAESPTGLPGETPTGMPGGAFACAGLPPTGSAACTITININVPKNPNPTQPASLISGLHPSDLQGAYALPSANAGGIVAVVDAYDAPTVESDLAVYRAAFGLPACTSANGCFHKLNQRGVAGSYPATNAGWAQEAALDVDVVSAGCPRCTLVLVEADSARLVDLGAAVDTAAAQHAIAIANSYYAIEWSEEQKQDRHFNHPGVAVTASSGDRGYPTYPSSSPYVTAVGGTSLTRSGSSWSQSAWPYTGHGCSAYVAHPSWQTATPCSTTRDAVDVATVADPQTGVATFDAAAGGWYVAGGTSVGAPLIAAGYALSGRPAGPSYSYAHPQYFRPVGGTGYQAVTGLGTPYGVAGL